MIEHQPNENIMQRIQEIYPEYMLMIRTYVSEGIVELDNPTSAQEKWSRMASLGNQDLARAIGQLARVTEIAHKMMFLEGKPMLIDFDSPAGSDDKGFGPIERFHFLRLFSGDFQTMGETVLTDPGE